MPMLVNFLGDNKAPNVPGKGKEPILIVGHRQVVPALLKGIIQG